MINRFSRTELIFGSEAMERLKNSRIAVIGLGSAGASCAEALARSAVGAIDLYSSKKLSRETLGGNIFANEETLGKNASDVAEARLLSINDELKIRKFPLPNEGDMPDFSGCDYIVNASFDEAMCVLLASAAKQADVPIISIMDFENALSGADSEYKIADVNKIKSASRLAFSLRKSGIKKHRIVYQTGDGFLSDDEFKGINACALGLIAAGEVVKDITGVRN